MPLSIFEELKRRRVIRVAGIYILASWVIVQVADVMFPALNLPDWTITLVAALMVLGFPVAMVLAWAFDVGPEGVTRTESSPVVDRKTDKRAMTAFGILLAAGTALLFFLFYREGPLAVNAIIAMGILVVATTALLFFLLYRGESKGDTTESEAVAPAKFGDKSMAVLPFVNISGDEENEYFSDGMTEELVNVLNRIEGLRVAARTSSFHFKGRNEKVQTIGEELGVAAVLEGSVRKSGDRVRVSAQLINVTDGFHLWSEVYDRELSDIFAVQDDIAQAIASALEVKLTGRTAAAAPSPPDMEAYQLYLRGEYLWKRREAESIREGIELFREAVGRDPGFARAYAGLGAAYHKLPLYDPGVDNIATQKLAERAAREALRLDPTLGEAHATVGSICAAAHRYTEAEAAFQKAIELEPDDATAHHWYAVFLLTTGRVGKAQDEIGVAHQLDPLNAAIAATRGSIRLAAGQSAKAIDNFNTADTLGWGRAAQAFAAIGHLSSGDREAAEKCFQNSLFSGERLPEQLISLIVHASDNDQALAAATEGIAASHEAGEISSALAFRLCAMIGARGLFDLGIAPAGLPAEAIAPLWYPSAGPIRRDPRFVELMEALELPPLWQSHGWPDRCRPAGSGFICE